MLGKVCSLLHANPAPNSFVPRLSQCAALDISDPRVGIRTFTSNCLSAPLARESARCCAGANYVYICDFSW